MSNVKCFFCKEKGHTKFSAWLTERKTVGHERMDLRLGSWAWRVVRSDHDRQWCGSSRVCKDNTSKDPFSRCEICKNLGYRLSGRSQRQEHDWGHEAQDQHEAHTTRNATMCAPTSGQPQNWVVDTWTTQNQKRLRTGETPRTSEQEMAWAKMATDELCKKIFSTKPDALDCFYYWSNWKNKCVKWWIDPAFVTCLAICY